MSLIDPDLAPSPESAFIDAVRNLDALLSIKASLSYAPSIFPGKEQMQRVNDEIQSVRQSMAYLRPSLIASVPALTGGRTSPVRF